MITDLGNLEFLIKNESDATYQVYSETLVKGEVTKIYADPLPIKLIIVPLSGQEIRNQDSGRFTSDDKLIIERKTQTLNKLDLVIFENTYEIDRIYNYLKEVGLVKYIAKKKGK